MLLLSAGGASLCCLRGVAELKSVLLYFPDTSLIVGELAALSITERERGLSLFIFAYVSIKSEEADM